ncbi:hypothetical protein BKA64DRAFT_670562 [Cadophora sp. MPI-SDFR-AT-0126]|nr:hypothetical protein BKA64DRAFT_670562 [Leotiomycetes sp. MPI-SDFR-AT-0126]
MNTRSSGQSLRGQICPVIPSNNHNYASIARATMMTTMTFVLPSAATTANPVVTSVSTVNFFFDSTVRTDNSKQNSAIEEVLSPKPIRRVSFDEIARQAGLIEATAVPPPPLSAAMTKIAVDKATTATGPIFTDSCSSYSCFSSSNNRNTTTAPTNYHFSFQYNKQFATKHLSELLLGSEPDYGTRARYGVIGGERAVKRIGVIGGYRVEKGRKREVMA